MSKGALVFIFGAISAVFASLVVYVCIRVNSDSGENTKDAKNPSVKK